MIGPVGPVGPGRFPSLLLILSLSLAGACDSGPKDTTPAKAESKASDAKAPDAKELANPHEGNPHAGMPPAGNPHAGNPHAGMPPMMGAPQAPKGPPRDVTPSGEVVAETLPGLSFAVPKEWEKGTPSNAMRLAQYVLPGPGGDGELVVFRFPGGAGGIEQNLTRWKGQFQPPEGKTIDDVSTTKTLEAGELKTTLVDVTGTYVAAMSPGAEEKHDDADQRMVAAIVEGSGDPFYFKAVGPKATMDVWTGAFDALVASFAKVGAAPGGGAPPPADDAKADDAKADAKAGGG
ncbi:hypothetical protein [Paraliomyxa miuraensis]|uniref:hypothetical protein n=1 Tax=Paraliomyxa miuraensis TaxID=376150 RepID=UPI00224D19DE|nr:hypothetical protein [Paraliomyxa miuraensis]MCX4240821.1 hypothetical protein [Paraliomyxa miuraensis]